MEFLGSDGRTVGVEIEFQILDGETYDLADGIVGILEGTGRPGNIKAEFNQGTVEIASDVCGSVGELEADVWGHFGELREAAEGLGYRLCAAGAHPFFEGMAHVTPDPRYRRMEEAAGYVAHVDVTFATHVHVGVEGRQELVDLARDFRAFLPVFTAMSANSPFWRGHRTGYVDFRHIALAMGRSYGLPPDFRTWEEFETFFEQARRAGIVETMRDFHWDVRPRPDLGTVELRTMDAFSTISESVAFAGFVQALAAYCRETSPRERDEGLPERVAWWFARENYFQASRVGMEAEYVDSEGEVRSLRGMVERTLEVVASVGEELGVERYLERVGELVERPGYRRQVEWYEEGGALEDVVERLVGVLAR